MSVYIKDMDMPVNCLACRIGCIYATSLVIGRPEGCPLEEAKTGDLISRADAIEAVGEWMQKEFGYLDLNRAERLIDALSALPSAEAVSREEYDHLEALYDAIRIYAPSAEAPTGELILRADAIELLTEIVFDEPPYFDSETLCRLYAEEQINTLPSAEIAETEPIAIRSRTLMPTKDFMEWAKRIKEVNPNAVVIPCDAEVASAEAVQGDGKMIPIELKKRYPHSMDEDITDAFMRGYKSAQAVQGWIPCSERLPERGLGMHYLVTLKDGHCFKDDVYEAFYDKYGWHIGDNELADDDVIAWMPLPKPYREDGEV